MKGTLLKRAIAGAMGLALVGIAAVGGAGCGSDTTTGPDPNAGKKADMVLLNANPGFPLPVVFYDGTTLIGNIAYGAPTQEAVQIGSRTINIKGTDGTQLTSSTVQIDSMHTVLVIHTGSTNASEAMGISTAKDTATMRTALNAGSALVRLINASKTAGAVDLRIGNSLGSKVAGNSDYKNVSSYTAVDTTTRKLVLTKANGTDTVAVSPININLVAGKTYSVVLFGSADANAVAPYKLTAITVTEP